MLTSLRLCPRPATLITYDRPSQGGLRPHVFCLPILKREEHRRAVAAAATSGHPRFFLGTDSAPHPKHAKVCLAHSLAGVSWSLPKHVRAWPSFHPHPLLPSQTLSITSNDAT